MQLQAMQTADWKTGAKLMGDDTEHDIGRVVRKIFGQICCQTDGSETLASASDEHPAIACPYALCYLILVP